MARNSDRWVTPAVVVTGLLVGGVVVLGIIAAVTYLLARGLDPDPMVKLVGAIVAALSSLATLALQLVNRSTVAKVERHTGVLAAGQLGRLEAPVDTERLGLHAARPTVPIGRPRGGQRS